MKEPILVADFLTEGPTPSARELVAAAAARGAAFVAADVADGSDESPDVQIGGERVSSLERLAKEAARHGVGLFLRLTDTLPIEELRAALGVERGTSSAALRDRFLVVVDGDRVGKRLRSRAPEFPSAYEAPAAGARGLFRFASHNYRRAVADADDLVLRWDGARAERTAVRLAPELARRGARLFLSGVPEPEVGRAARTRAAGLVVICAPGGGPLRT